MIALVLRALMDWRVMLAGVLLLIGAALYVTGGDNRERAIRAEINRMDDAARDVRDRVDLDLSTCEAKGGRWNVSTGRCQ